MNQKHNAQWHIITKDYNYGSSDPFVARMMMEIFEIRDFVFAGEDKRRDFDKIYNPILQNLREARLARERCFELVNNYSQKVSDGKIANIENNTITIIESIDDDLNIWFKDFFIRGYIASKNLERLGKFLGYDISFFFENNSKFEDGGKKFVESNPTGMHQFIIDMVSNDRREWYSDYVKIRNQIEHEGFCVPKIVYSMSKNKHIEAVFPRFSNIDILTYLDVTWNNLFAYFEDIMVFIMTLALPKELVIMNIPEKSRDPEKPIKYKVVPRSSIPREAQQKSYGEIMNLKK